MRALIHPRPKVFEGESEPHSRGLALDFSPTTRRLDDPSGRSNYARSWRFERVEKDLLLEAVELINAILRSDVSACSSSHRFDVAIRVAVRTIEVGSKKRSDGGLAGAHHSE